MEPEKVSSPLNIKTVEMHTGGGPVRIVESGFPQVLGKTILDKLDFIKNNLDYVRTFLMLEPRGHHDQFGVILVEPDLEEADIAAIFINNDGYCTMCGHAVMALGRYVVDTKLNKHEPATDEDGKQHVDTYIQCPCGLVKAIVELVDGESASVSLLSVPAFMAKKDVTLQTQEYGPVTVDIGYGGGFYVLATDRSVGLEMGESLLQSIVDAGAVLKSAAKSQLELEHPDHEDLAFIFGTIITDGKDAFSSDATSNICVFADKQADRSPCGSGVTARIAVQFAREKIALNQQRIFKNGETGSIFRGMPVEETTCGDFPAVRVQVTGRAFYTGKCSFTYEEEDEMKHGFMIK